ncbi:DUF4442 domain-containing protein [Pseudoxanthomonas wuyuanensis]|uniref:Acyl-coenzyme A thioesterase PaaI, contains HGG motif n=1 Tax=Pseudoxanthomonas wuyuanensis TaxID=1073196 RepID=A0A286D705_9GAMM|nr:DUF4442 domain-containing protein [Pseudoxanthomonas wuyuanensis]KAF1721127.1 DUF4442 domain-containing protein [Pseudoxanthomonas wuyuanensis]SOD54432.1 protein of unknown function [Pseudoxanthomonas wuyuanensis]
MKPSTLRHLFNFWPPFLFSGVHVTEIADDWRFARVELRMRPWNRNYVGTHFGGSLFAMTDPFWMIMAKERLGRDYYVWDKTGEIEFVKPAMGTVHAEFRLDDVVLDEIRAAAANGQKHLRWMPVDVFNAQNEVVARVRKQIYVRLKPEARGKAQG